MLRARDLTVTNSGGSSGTLTGGFTVTTAVAPAALSVAKMASSVAEWMEGIPRWAPTGPWTTP
jgi:hypothetical protein